MKSCIPHHHQSSSKSSSFLINGLKRQRSWVILSQLSQSRKPPLSVSTEKRKGEGESSLEEWTAVNTEDWWLGGKFWNTVDKSDDYIQILNASAFLSGVPSWTCVCWECLVSFWKEMTKKKGDIALGKMKEDWKGSFFLRTSVKVEFVCWRILTCLSRSQKMLRDYIVSPPPPPPLPTCWTVCKFDFWHEGSKYIDGLSRLIWSFISSANCIEM